MTQLNKNISPDAYNEFLSDVATAVQQHRVQAIQSVQTIVKRINREITYIRGFSTSFNF